MPKIKHITRTIAPRLASKECRDPISHGLPPEIKAGLWDIAVAENRSVSWVLEQALIDYFGLKRPRYVVRKKTVKKHRARRKKKTRKEVV